jgi:Ca2+-binding RTX toxin-like protein
MSKDGPKHHKHGFDDQVFGQLGLATGGGLLDATSGEDDGSAASLTVPVPPAVADPLEGLRWPAGTVVTWSFAAGNLPDQPLGLTFSDAIAGGAQALVEKAAALWSSVSGVTLEQVADSAASDIRVGWEMLTPASTDTIGQTAWADSGGVFTPGVMVGLEDPTQVTLSPLPDGDDLYGTTGTHLFQVMVHEFGHALGLAHNTVDAAAVMAPVSTARNRSIDGNDAAAIEALYGGSDSAAAAVAITPAGNEDFAVVAGGAMTPFTGLAVTDGAGLHEVVSVIVTGGGTIGDPTAGTDARFDGGEFTESGDNLGTTDYAETILHRLVYTAPGPGGASGSASVQGPSSPPASFRVEVDNSLQGSAVNSGVTVNAAAQPSAPGGLGVVDTSVGQPVAAGGQAYTGPVAGVQQQFIDVTADNLSITATTPNWFLHSGSGMDALTVRSGTNVLDGGTGSNFLTGGTGTDTFFVDDRGAAQDIWSTISNFHAGDAVTLYGVSQSSFQVAWADGEGAAGFAGLTLHATAPGQATASMTLVGFTQPDLTNGRLSVSYGFDAGSGSNYMYIHEDT